MSTDGPVAANAGSANALCRFMINLSALLATMTASADTAGRLSSRDARSRLKSVCLLSSLARSPRPLYQELSFFLQGERYRLLCGC